MDALRELPRGFLGFFQDEIVPVFGALLGLAVWVILDFRPHATPFPAKVACSSPPELCHHNALPVSLACLLALEALRVSSVSTSPVSRT